MELITLIAGTPGSGKTIVGRLLSRELDCNHTTSSELARQAGIIVRDYTGRYTSVIKEDELSKLISLTINLSKGKCLVLETIYPSIWLEHDEVQREIPLVLLLRCHPIELYQRLKQARDWPEDKVLENTVAEAFNIVGEELLPYEHDVIEVDTSGKQPLQVVEEFWGKLERWETGIRIDWLMDESVVRMLPVWLSRLDRDKYRLGV
jgi:adenylate kinase